MYVLIEDRHIFVTYELLQWVRVHAIDHIMVKFNSSPVITIKWAADPEVDQFPLVILVLQKYILYNPFMSKPWCSHRVP